jgi:hypothetical protein
VTDHDFDHPHSHMNAVEMAWLAADSTVPLCPYCKATGKMLPMTGAAWGLDVHHEDTCPRHEDNQPARRPESHE